MRGDSIRDFYAKTLALLGLGVLAGTGALVDYWPSTPNALPVAAPVFKAPSFAWALPAPAPGLPAPTAVTATTATTATGDRAAVVLAMTPVQTLALSTALADAGLGQPVALYEPAPVLLAAVSVQPISFVADAEAATFDTPVPEPFTTLAAAELEPEETELVSLAAPAGDEDRDGLITGASKRIGASIIKGSLKVGASFSDMAQDMAHFFGRSVRRVLPN